MKQRVIAVVALLLACNLGAWAWALVSLHHFPVLLGTALLAYTFGLRHAVDADHIAAIDNVTRKLMQQGQRPVGVGFFFSLGHSTIVFGLSVVIAIASVAIKDRLAAWADLAGTFGTAVSAAFLFLIAGANCLVLVSVYRTFRRVKQGGAYTEENLDLVLGGSGFFKRPIRALFRMVRKSWQMYLVGFLFGLGFDTATEVGLLGISAKEASTGLPIWSILIFPTLFTAGMSLVDTADGIVMLGAYRWAFAKPLRKLHYNLTITFISIVVAVLVGGVEVLGLVGGHVRSQNSFWREVCALNDHFGLLGFIVIGVFVASWAVSLALYRRGHYDEIRIQPV